MEATRQEGFEKFVGIVTVCSYPKFTPTPFKEEDLWGMVTQKKLMHPMGYLRK